MAAAIKQVIELILAISALTVSKELYKSLKDIEGILEDFSPLPKKRMKVSET